MLPLMGTGRAGRSVYAARMRMSRAAGVALVGLVVAPLPAAPARADVSGPQIVSFVNAQRAAHGVPAGIVEDAALSSGCARHNAYGLTNGVLTHGEEPSRPGYSPEGDQAAKASVIYFGSGPWTAARNPFETAPVHLHQLLAPRIDRMGASENQGYGCATTLASRNRPAPPADVTYTYPGDGATGWSPSQLAAESPATPGERVGIPAGTTTGPYLYVMFDGPKLSVSSIAAATQATLTGPDGAVPVAVVDNRTSGLEGILPTGMEVIPRTPLRPGGKYTASVAATVTRQGGSSAFAKTWSFTAGAIPNAVRLTQTTSARQVQVGVKSDAPGAVVVATGPGATQSRPVDAAGNATIALDADGTWQVCARSGGAPSSYAVAQDCATVTASQSQAVTGSQAAAAPKPPRARRPFTVSVPNHVRRGQPIKLAITAVSSFSMHLRLTGAGRRTLKRLPNRRYQGGGATTTFELAVPSASARRGRSLRLVVIVNTRGRTYAVVRTIRISRR